MPLQPDDFRGVLLGFPKLSIINFYISIAYVDRSNLSPRPLIRRFLSRTYGGYLVRNYRPFPGALHRPADRQEVERPKLQPILPRICRAVSPRQIPDLTSLRVIPK